MKASEILKTEGIVTCGPDDSISSVLSKLQSSHDAAFVLKGEQYMGVLNPYYSLIKHNKYMGDSLVKHALYHPPRITPTDTIERIVGLMVDSRLHYLPVMDGDVFNGIVSARRILRSMADEKIFDKSVLEALQTKSKPLVSVYLTDEVNKIVKLFETEDVSKLVVVDEALKLQGIMSYYDLIPHLLVPTERLDPRDKTGFDGKDPYLGLTVKNVAKKLVHTQTPDALLRDCLLDITTRSIGSVVIVNREGFPAGIVTVRDLLQKLTRTEAEPLIELSTNDISPGNLEILYSYGPKLERWVRKIKDLQRATLYIKEEKNGGLFSASLTIMPKKGKATTYKAEDKTLLAVLQKINKNN